jgi:hypothetical protein
LEKGVRPPEKRREDAGVRAELIGSYQRQLSALVKA